MGKKSCETCKRSEPEVKIGAYRNCSKCRWKINTKAEEHPEALEKIKELEKRNKELEKFEAKYQKHKKRNLELQNEIAILKLENEKLNTSLKFENKRLQTTLDIFTKLNLNHG